MSDAYKNFWLCMEALAAGLACDESHAEPTLNQMDHELQKMSGKERDAVRRRMICIVAQLSRLEIRMMTSHGPLDPLTS